MKFAGKATLGYDTRSEAVAALYMEGLSVEQIAAKIGSTTRAVSCLMRFMRNKHGFQGYGYHRAVLTVAAHKRRMTVHELELQLLDIIARHNLVDAILDDQGEEATQEAAE